MSDRYEYGLVTQNKVIIPAGNDCDEAIGRADRTGYQLVYRRLGEWLPLFPDTPEQLSGPDPKRVAPQEETRA